MWQVPGPNTAQVHSFYTPSSNSLLQYHLIAQLPSCAAVRALGPAPTCIAEQASMTASSEALLQ